LQRQKKDTMTEQFFMTSDLYVAGFLLIKRIPYRGAHRSERNVQFHFALAEEVTSLVIEYENGTEVSAKEFGACVRFLAGELRKANGNGGSR
jgi:hypothetical protein